MNSEKKSGSCLCGGVRFHTTEKLADIVNCFCGQCRKSSGHYVAATRVKQVNLHFDANETLRWYQSSEAADRGFCGNCGSSLFWRPRKRDTISIMAGCIDTPLGVKTVENLFAEFASDYHAIPQACATKKL